MLDLRKPIFQLAKRGAERRCSGSAGFSLVELVITIAVAATLTAIAIPQMIAQRRVIRSVAVAQEIMTQLRNARQLAMSQRQAVTFQYDNTAKQLTIIDHNASGTAVLTASDYPYTAGCTVVTGVPLTQAGLTTSEIKYGVPTAAQLPIGAPTPPSTLGDGISLTALSSSKINITFQPDGSVRNASGNPVDRAMYIFNSLAAQSTLSGISVVGASGRVKVWRYSVSGNTFTE